MKTYYIYHIPGVKIGCTVEPQRRINHQGYTEYEILEIHTCIDTASERELELQKEYGYKVDNMPYKQSIEQRLKGVKKGGTVAGNKTLKNNTGIFKFTKKERHTINKKGAQRTKEILSKPILQYNLNDEFVKEYPSLNEASRQTGIPTSNLSNVCNKVYRYKTAGGYKWKYKV